LVIFRVVRRKKISCHVLPGEVLFHFVSLILTGSENTSGISELTFPIRNKFAYRRGGWRNGGGREGWRDGGGDGRDGGMEGGRKEEASS
jgi:hypothetical protein